jgi:outer membrane protein TolC
VIAFLSLAAAAPAIAQETAMTLDEAIERALVVQPTMVQARGDRRNAGAASRSALGAFLPSVSASASAARSNVGRVDASTGRPVPPEFTYTLGIGANLGLFEGFERLAARKEAAANLDAAEVGLRRTSFQVTLDTKQSFYGSAARQEIVRVAEAQHTRAEQQLDISVDKVRAGSATRSDSLRATVEVGNARIALLQARAELATAQASLGRQVGLDSPVRALADSALPVFPDTSSLRERAADSAPLVLEREAQLQAARAQAWGARSQYWPSLGVSVNENRQGVGSPFSSFDGYDRTTSVRFAMSWALFNGFARETAQVQAAVRREVAEATLEDARRELNARLTEELAALSTAYAQIDIAAANVAAASEDFRVQNERYRVGAATILETTESQANLVQAEVSLVQARFNYLTARAELEALVGSEL